MSKLYAVKSGNYVVVDFDNVTESGLKTLTGALKRAGQTVTSIEATNRKGRKDGLFTKKAKLIFENEQAITIFIGDQGDIYQMTINGIKQPVPAVKNEQDLAKNLATILKKGQAKFDKSQIKKAGRVPSTASHKPLSRSIKTRVEESRKQLSQLAKQKTDADTRLSSTRGTLSELVSQVARLKAMLDSEKQETSQLKQELDNAKKGIA